MSLAPEAAGGPSRRRLAFAFLLTPLAVLGPVLALLGLVRAWSWAVGLAGYYLVPAWVLGPLVGLALRRWRPLTVLKAMGVGALMGAGLAVAAILLVGRGRPMDPESFLWVSTWAGMATFLGAGGGVVFWTIATAGGRLGGPPARAGGKTWLLVVLAFLALSLATCLAGYRP